MILVLSRKISTPKILVKERKGRTSVTWGQADGLPPEFSLNLPCDELCSRRFINGSPDDCVEQ